MLVRDEEGKGIKHSNCVRQWYGDNCMFTYLSVDMCYVCMYMYMCMFAYVYNMCKCVYVCVSINVCACVFEFVCVYMHRRKI